MRGAEDEEVSELSRTEGRILITCDRDFGFLALSYGLPGLILLRLRDERTENKIRRTLDVIERFGLDLYGRLIVISDARIRVRRLREEAFGSST